MLEKLPEVVGHALRDQRAGLEKIAYQRLRLRTGMAAIQVTSLAFVDHGPIPAHYTADGAGASPPLQWTAVPAAAQSLVLIVEDADSPTPHPLVHAIAVDLPPGDGALAEGALIPADSEDEGKPQPRLGRNSYLRSGWLPPDPPPGHGTHRYAFQLFALAETGNFSGTPGRDAIMDVLNDKAIASGCLIGTYARPDTSIRADEPSAATLGPSVVGP